ncbi:MAG: LysR family transcriptional regulator [Syntrophomonadaceae bacterium]|nr:LysR family transcriptional regulator [Syntrophomonadaceae bacterium]
MFQDQYEIIPIVAETKSFSKAARLLHLSQPAISSKIQAMEDYYGIKFFTRTSQGVTLTEAGKIVCNYASKFSEMQQSMETELNQLLNISNPQLIIGSSCTSGNYAMPNSIQGFKEKYPQANIKLNIANSMDTLQKLRNREVDVAVVDGPIMMPGYNVHYLDTLQLVFIALNQDHVKMKKKLSLKELRTKPLIIREKGAAVRSVIEELAAKNSFTLGDFNVVAEMNSLHSIRAAVKGGAGITIIPLVAVQQEIESGILRIIQVEEFDLRIDVNLIYSASVESSLIAQNFIKFISKSEKNFSWE